MTPALRLASGLQWASPIASGTLPAPDSASSKAGIAYQRKVGKALAATIAKIGGRLVSEPWFRFQDNLGLGQIVPDFILESGDIVLVIEVKLTFLSEGLEKLHGLYLPVVKLTTRGRTRGLLICRNLTPDVGSTPIIHTLSPALKSVNTCILQYLGQGPIPF